MSPEHTELPSKPETPAEAFGFTEREILFDRVSDTRFQSFLNDEATSVHRIEVAANSYGEFAFCTLSRPGSDRRIFFSFFGQGYHELRERWITQEWFYYRTQPWPELIESLIPKSEALERIQARRADVEALATREAQSRRGELFELLADLGDDDGAIAAMDDLPWWLFDDEP